MTEQMRKIKRNISTAIFYLLIFSAGGASAANSVDLNKPVFEFQNKLANKGVATAQYHLAQMYEEGRGTAVDLNMAGYWYEQAKQNGYETDNKR